MNRLFDDLSANAIRQSKTERLFIPKLLEKQTKQPLVDAKHFEKARAIIIRWADLESKGKLQKIKETQLQGDFLTEIFGDALGYVRRIEGGDDWQLEQHRSYGMITPDAVLGRFLDGHPRKQPVAVIELKGPQVHLDRDRSGGRTAVQQCWDYLDQLPEAQWGVVSNIVSFRLYERNHTPRRYEHFALQDLRDESVFREFYTLLSPRGLLLKTAGTIPPIAEYLLQGTDNRQREVGEDLYQKYRLERLRLIDHLHNQRGIELEESVAFAQRLLDRILFIAFCEDRKLLPDKSLDNAYKKIPPFTKATNPRWKNFVELFRAVDEGADGADIPAFNGGLFAESEVDHLDLDDSWTDFFKDVGTYDFAEEINLDVLGHLFEKSITELEKLREGALFGEDAKDEIAGQMPKSAKRKKMGVYYTPPSFTRKITELTVDTVVNDRFIECAQSLDLDPKTADTVEFWLACLEALKQIKIVDPACGSGAFLFQAYEAMEARYLEVVGHLAKHDVSPEESIIDSIPDIVLVNNIYGVDLSPESVEITQLAMWIRTARRGKTLATLSHNIRAGNSLVHDPEISPVAFDWKAEFPEVFCGDHPGFDCVIGNPPWERIKLQEREFFSLSEPAIAKAPNAATRTKMVAKLQKSNPELHTKYLEAKQAASVQLEYCRKTGAYPLTGKGDINTYAVFAELASQIVADNGRVGLVVPSGIASDNTTRKFFGMLAETGRLHQMYDFENKLPYFEDVHRSFKFCILCFGGEQVTVDEADFVFFSRRIDELANPKRHIKLSGDDIKLVNPNTLTCPIFRSSRDAELTKAIYRRVPVLIHKAGKKVKNEWGLKFSTMFHQTNDAEHFVEPEFLRSKKYKLDGNRFVKGKNVYLPLFEGKMIHAYDHRANSVLPAGQNWMRQNQKSETTDAEHTDPDFVALPRFWIESRDLEGRVLDTKASAWLSFKEVTSSTNTRTMIASFVPECGAVNSMPIIEFQQELGYDMQSCMLANLNSFVYDWVARQKVGGLHLNFFIVDQLPMLMPYQYEQECPWTRSQSLKEWISERALKLTCTSTDMIPLAEAAGFDKGDSADGRVNRWKPQERADLLAELDAAYFHLYGIEREDAEYILSTFNIAGKPVEGLPGTRTLAERILDTYDHFASKSL